MERREDWKQLEQVISILHVLLGGMMKMPRVWPSPEHQSYIFLLLCSFLVRDSSPPPLALSEKLTRDTEMCSDSFSVSGRRRGHRPSADGAVRGVPR